MLEEVLKTVEHLYNLRVASGNPASRKFGFLETILGGLYTPPHGSEPVTILNRNLIFGNEVNAILEKLWKALSLDETFMPRYVSVTGRLDERGFPHLEIETLLWVGEREFPLLAEHREFAPDLGFPYQFSLIVEIEVEGYPEQAKIGELKVFISDPVMASVEGVRGLDQDTLVNIALEQASVRARVREINNHLQAGSFDLTSTFAVLAEVSERILDLH